MVPRGGMRSDIHRMLFFIYFALGVKNLLHSPVAQLRRRSRQPEAGALARHVIRSMSRLRECSRSPTSPTSLPGQSSPMSPSSSTPMREKYRRQAGEPDGACELRLGRSGTRLSTICGRSIMGSCTTATGAANTSAFDTLSAWRRPASSCRSAASATATTMLSPKRSTAFTRLR